MLFKHTTPNGGYFAKDPCVVRLNGQAFMYYSTPVYKADRMLGFQIGIARSEDLENWTPCGYIRPEQEVEGNGVCAPAGIVLDGVLHLFYQSYGQFPRDYICHATSMDGLNFERDITNPIVKPEGDWNIGRAIDADVCLLKDTLFLYWATRDPEGKIQMLGVSGASVHSDFSRKEWQQLCSKSILKPELPWEQECIEAPATLVHDGKIYMFYAGAYNCSPQQINCAVSTDGIYFTRIQNEPMLTNGREGAWNASESGHPYAWQDDDGCCYLFYQGSPDQGKTWLISRADILFDENGMPQIKPSLE